MIVFEIHTLEKIDCYIHSYLSGFNKFYKFSLREFKRQSNNTIINVFQECHVTIVLNGSTNNLQGI